MNPVELMFHAVAWFGTAYAVFTLIDGVPTIDDCFIAVTTILVIQMLYWSIVL